MAFRARPIPFGLLLGVLACGGSAGDSPGGDGSLSSADEVRLEGRVVHASDVATIPDEPYARGTILAVPAPEWRRLGVTFEPGRRVSIDLSLRTDVRRAGLDSEGRFALSLALGDWVLCASDLGFEKRKSAPRWPLTLYGCLEASFGEPSAARVEMSFGEGGFAAEIDR